MTSRRHTQPSYEGHSVQTQSLLRHGPIHRSELPSAHWLLEPLHPSELLQNKIAAQAAEIDHRALDNRRLATDYVAMKQELVDANTEAEKIKAYIKSLRTESDIQIRVLLDKIAKMELGIRADDNVRKDLQQAHFEAQSLVKAKQELTAQIQQASQELQQTHADLKSIPKLLAELGGLRKEHQRLRATFQFEKGLNIERVQQLQTKEKNLIAMAREVENLRAGVLGTGRRAHAPNVHGGGYMNPDPSYPPSVQGGSDHVDGYGRHMMQMGSAVERMFSYGGSSVPGAAAEGNTAVPGAAWDEAYDRSLAQR